MKQEDSAARQGTSTLREPGEGQLSTREQIRAEAADRIARFAYESDVDGSWDAAPDPDKALVRDWAFDLVDALGDLLPPEGHAASVYVGTAPDGSPRAVFEDIADAQTWVAKMIAARGDHRYGYVTAPWTPQREVMAE